MIDTEETMNAVKLVAVGGLVVATSIPVFAENIEALKPGEAIAIMPDGHMARGMITDAKKLDELKKNSKAIPWCNMLMAGADGKVFVINTDLHYPMLYCEDMMPQ
jgi:hypothetical protein